MILDSPEFQVRIYMLFFKHSCWDNRTCSNIGLGWTAEMFGYVFAASELGIRHEIWDLQVDSRLFYSHNQSLTYEQFFLVFIRIWSSKIWWFFLGQVVPPMHNEITASIIHYHIKVELSDGRSWYVKTLFMSFIQVPVCFSYLICLWCSRYCELMAGTSTVMMPAAESHGLCQQMQIILPLLSWINYVKRIIL